MVYITKSNATTAGWYAVGNSDLQANTSHGGTIPTLSGNSRTYLDGNGEWNPGPIRYERMEFQGTGSLIFDINIPSSLKRMSRYIYVVASSNVAVGFLNISFPASSSEVATVNLYLLAGHQGTFNTITITPTTINNGSQHRISISHTGTSNRVITLLGVDDALPIPTSTSNATYNIYN